MPRHHHHRTPEKAPAQRQLRAGELVRCGFTAVFLMIILTALVHAEVCDKALGDSWRPSDGPVWLLNPVGWPLALLVGGLAMVIFFRLPWLGYVGSAVLVLVLLVGFCIDRLSDTAHVYEMMVREGCRSQRTDLLNGLMLACFAVVYGLLGYRIKSRAPAS